MDEDFQIWQLERQLLAQRLTIFLLVTSILFLSFVQVKTIGVGILIAVAGLVSCLLAGLHFSHVKRRFEGKRLKAVEQRVGFSGGLTRGRLYASVIFPIFFGLLWLAALTYVTTYPWLKTGEFELLDLFGKLEPFPII